MEKMKSLLAQLAVFGGVLACTYVVLKVMEHRLPPSTLLLVVLFVPIATLFLIAVERPRTLRRQAEKEARAAQAAAEQAAAARKKTEVEDILGKYK